MALLLTLLAAGAVTWLGVAMFVGSAVSDTTWSWIERGSWFAALAGIYLAVRGPRTRDAALAPNGGAPDSASAIYGDAASVTEPRDVVRRLWTDVEELLARDNQRRIADGEPIRTRKQIAKAANIPSRQLNRWLKVKRQLPEEKRFLGLIGGLGGDLRKWEVRWHRADAVRHRLTGGDAEVAEKGQSSQVVPNPRNRMAASRDRRALFGATTLGGLLVGALVAGTQSIPIAVDDLGGKPSPKTWPGMVFGTFRTDPGGGNPVDVGVYAYRGPYRTPADREELGSYFNGDHVRVVSAWKTVGRSRTVPIRRSHPVAGT